jgi:hypothetical protein
VVGVERIDQAEAEAAARGGAVDAVGVAEGVAGGGGEDGDVDVDFVVLDGLPAAAVGAEDAEAAHFAGRAVVADGAVHGAFDVVDDAGLDQGDERGVAGEAGGGEPDEVFDAQLGGVLEERHGRSRTEAGAARKPVSARSYGPCHGLGLLFAVVTLIFF